MRRLRGIWLILPLIIVLATATGAEVQDVGIQKVLARLESLELQMRSLDAQIKALDARLRVVEPKSGAPAAGALPGAPDPKEAEAQAMMKEVERLADRGEYEPARAKLSEVRTKYPTTKAAGLITYYGRELEVFGKDAPADWGVEKWFQGESAIDLSGQKPTLLVFWEEWCPHCRNEMPKIQQLFEANKAKGLQVIGVTKINQTSTEDKVRDFISKSNVLYPIVKENGSLSTYFNVGGIPAAAVVKNGKVVWRGHPARITEEMVKHWL